MVKPGCIRDALEMARALILREYLNDVEALSDRLSSSRRQTDFSAELLSRLKTYERMIPGVHLAWGPHNTTESYRRFLSYIFHKLQKTRAAVDAPAAIPQRSRVRRRICCWCVTVCNRTGESGWPGFLGRFAVTQAANIWISSAHARHPAACSRARAGAGGTWTGARAQHELRRRVANCSRRFAPSPS